MLIAALVAAVTVLGTNGATFAAAFLMLFAAPTVGVVALLRRRDSPAGARPLNDATGWTSTSSLVVIATLTACALFCLMFGSALAVEGGIQALYRDAFVEAAGGMEAIKDILAEANSPMTAEAFLGVFGAVAPAALSIVLMLTVVANAWIALWVLGRLGHSIRPPLKITSVRLPEYMGIGLLILIGSTVFGGQIEFAAWSLVAVLLAAYFFVGLGLAQIASEGRRFHPFFLVVFYMAMAVFPGLSIFVALLGLADQWFGLRQRFKAIPANRAD